MLDLKQLSGQKQKMRDNFKLALFPEQYNGIYKQQLEKQKKRYNYLSPKDML
jgi:hypothetical protein